jgi:hypothetical protein
MLRQARQDGVHTLYSTIMRIMGKEGESCKVGRYQLFFEKLFLIAFTTSSLLFSDMESDQIQP